VTESFKDALAAERAARKVAAVAALCDALSDQYDDLEFFPVVAGEPLPPGARVLPAAPVDGEAGFDVGVGATADGGGDGD
jgi:hypothetical protein